MLANLTSVPSAVDFAGGGSPATPTSAQTLPRSRVRARCVSMKSIGRAAFIRRLIAFEDDCGIVVSWESVLSFDLRPDPQLLKITSVCKGAVALFARGLGEHAQILQELDGLARGRLRCLE
jgi:hypothetical protein